LGVSDTGAAGSRPQFGVIGTVHGVAGAANPIGAGVAGEASGLRIVGIRGHAANDDGVVGLCDANVRSGVFGFNSSSTGLAFGVFGRCDSPSGVGVQASSLAGDAVSAFSATGKGILGVAPGGVAVEGRGGTIGFLMIALGVLVSLPAPRRAAQASPACLR
jgi:hypothetical protein